MHTMFKSVKEKKDFFTALEQACFLKNSCVFEPENMKVNVTLEEGDLVDNYDLEKDEIDPNGLWVVRTV